MKLVWKKILTDPAFWLLLLVNCYLVYKYERTPQIFTTLIWLYFSQNILYGIFNYLDMSTVRDVDVATIRENNISTKSDKRIARNYAGGVFIFFLFFHFVYFIFLISMKSTGPFDWEFYKRFLLMFLGFQVMTFIQNKIRSRKIPAKILQMSFLPMARVVPMHLCLLIPAFLNVSHLTVFLVLKVIADVVAYVSTTNYYRKNELDLKTHSIDINSTFTEL